MNRSKVNREAKKWVKEGIITVEQKNEIASTYNKKDSSYLLLLFATLFISIGVLIIVWADWAQVPNPLRITLMIGSMVSLYLLGNHYYHKSEQHVTLYPPYFAVTLILLGYVFFGATMLLLMEIYHIVPLSVWPYAVWSVIGLCLYVFYPHRLIYMAALLITIVGQAISNIEFNTFHPFLFLLFITGYFYVTYKRDEKLPSYLFAIGFSLQCVMVVQTWLDNYYWLILAFILLYGVSVIVQKESVQEVFFYISIVSIFVFKLFETILVQESQFMRDLTYEPTFFVLIAISIIGLLIFYMVKMAYRTLMDLLLFLPLFFLPYAYIFILASMFIFAIYSLIHGFKTGGEERRFIGIVTFIMSTVTVYIQFAWETINKSLFFIIGGMLLFVLSFFLQKQKRQREIEKRGDE